jgi:hypothetical protein
MRRSHALLLALATIFGSATALPTATHADPYRWCAIYGLFEGSAENCYFMTIEQCRAAVSGVGGFCRVNLFYDGRPEGSESRNVRKKKRR